MKYRKKFEIDLEHQSDYNASIRLFVTRQFTFRYKIYGISNGCHNTIYNSNQ